MKFVPPRRVVAATAVSVLFHLTLFGLLALFSGGSYSLPTLSMEEFTPAEPLVFEIEAPLSEPAPETTPEPTPEPLLAALPEPAPSATPVPPAAQAPQPLRTALDPEHLKESAEAPENPVFVASHHSRASAPARPESQPPPPSPEAGGEFEAVAAPFQAAQEALPEAGSDGEVAIDAIGDWKKAVGNRIGSRWNEFRESQAGLLAVGSVRVRFAIDAKGDVSSLKIVSSTASEANAEYALRAVREADLPPIPPERLARAPDGRIEIEFTFTIFPNR